MRVEKATFKRARKKQELCHGRQRWSVGALERGGKSFAIRPEKIRMADAGAAPVRGNHGETGRIREVVYAGMVTRYLVELDRGGELQVVRQNLETSSAEALDQQGRNVILEWRPEHQLEIDPEPGETEGEQ